MDDMNDDERQSLHEELLAEIAEIDAETVTDDGPTPISSAEWIAERERLLRERATREEADDGLA